MTKENRLMAFVNPYDKKEKRSNYQHISSLIFIQEISMSAVCSFDKFNFKRMRNNTCCVDKHKLIYVFTMSLGIRMVLVVRFLSLVMQIIRHK